MKNIFLSLLFLMFSGSACSQAQLATVLAFPGGGAVSAAPAAGGYGGATLLSGGAVALGALTVGMAIGYYGLEALLGESVRVQVSDSALAVPPAPAAPAPTPAGPVYCYGGDLDWKRSCAATSSAACQSTAFIGVGRQVWSSYYGNTFTYSSGSASWEGGQCVLRIWGSAPGYQTVLWSVNNVSASAVPFGCVNGFTLSGTSCVYSGEARKEIPDQKCDVLLASGQFSTAADLDCPSSASGSVLSPLIRGNSTYAYGVNSSGQPLMFEVSRLDNVVYVREYLQTSVNGQSQVQSFQATINPSTGLVTSVSGSVSPGSISAPSGASGSVPTTAPSPDPATTPTVNTNTGQQTQQQPFTFPSDYARTGEAASAANSLKPNIDGVKNSVDGVKDKLTNTDNVDDPTPGQWVDPWGNSFSNLIGWRLPGHSSQCPAGSFQWPWTGQIMVIDSHCQLAADHLPIISAVMIAVWSILGLRVVLKA